MMTNQINIIVKIQLRRYPTAEKSDLYEFKIVLFDNSAIGEFLLFARNFNVTLKASGTLNSGVNIQYRCNLVRGEELCQFDTLPTKVGSAIPENLTSIILGVGTYFFLLMRCQIKSM